MTSFHLTDFWSRSGIIRISRPAWPSSTAVIRPTPIPIDPGATVPLQLPQWRDQHRQDQPQRRPCLRLRPGTAVARRPTAHAQDERLGGPRRMAGAPHPRKRVLVAAAGVAAHHSAGLGERGRRLGAGRGGRDDLHPPGLRQPVRLGRAGRRHRHRRHRRGRPRRSHGLAARVRWCSDKRGWPASPASPASSASTIRPSSPAANFNPAR